MASINQIFGGFLLAEGVISLIFQGNQGSLWQADKFIRMGIGAYLYVKK